MTLYRERERLKKEYAESVKELELANHFKRRLMIYSKEYMMFKVNGMLRLTKLGIKHGVSDAN